MNYQGRVIEAAISRIERQSLTPVSPGMMVEGTPCLCLAAALAFGGILNSEGPLEAEKFANYAAENHADSKEAVRSAFRRLDWPLEECSIRMQYNDSLPDEVRKEKLLHLLRTLPVDQWA